jgi:hypothetical protein
MVKGAVKSVAAALKRGPLPLLVFLISVGQAAQAAPLWNTPVYDPGSKSYFELVPVTTKQYATRDNPELNWRTAYQLAKQMEYNGVHGRLAVVSDLEVHEFLLRTFRPEHETWIGLRYLCGAHLLQDVTGRTLPRGSFQAWDAQWNHSTGLGCNDRSNPADYMTVYYAPTPLGMRWAAHTSAKAWSAYFVEFPTGKP